jgi:hypothetical protein
MLRRIIAILRGGRIRLAQIRADCGSELKNQTAADGDLLLNARTFRSVRIRSIRHDPMTPGLYW